MAFYFFEMRGGILQEPKPVNIRYGHVRELNPFGGHENRDEAVDWLEGIENDSGHEYVRSGLFLLEAL